MRQAPSRGGLNGWRTPGQHAGRSPLVAARWRGAAFSDEAEVRQRQAEAAEEILFLIGPREVHLSVAVPLTAHLASAALCVLCASALNRADPSRPEPNGLS